jgi:hypothetical protein
LKASVVNHPTSKFNENSVWIFSVRTVFLCFFLKFGKRNENSFSDLGYFNKPSFDVTKLANVVDVAFLSKQPYL